MNMTTAGMWQVVGIGEAEEGVYEALVTAHAATVEDLTQRTGMTAGRVSRAIQLLVEQGFATRLPGRPAQFAAAEPELMAAGLIAAREHELSRLRAHAKRLAESSRLRTRDRHPAELIEVVEGTPNIRNAFLRLQACCRRQLRVFDKPPYFEQPEDGDGTQEWNPGQREALADQQIDSRCVYDRASLTIPGRVGDIWEAVRCGVRTRVAASVPLKLAIADDRQALITSVADDGEGAAYLVHPSALLDALSALFEAVWERSVPLNQPTNGVDGEPAMSEQRRDLLGLLAGGATDEAIARTFGWSARTVQRHVHALMAEVGAQTRFQIGMEAARRGWV